MIAYLTQKIGEVCPIFGLNSEGVISFMDEATESEREAAALKYAQLTTPSAIATYEQIEFEAGIKAQILAIEEREIMPRKTREIQIQVMLFFGQQQGLTHDQLYAVNPAYKGMVDVDNEIKALRALL
jgi:hypothetical protein